MADAAAFLEVIVFERFQFVILTTVLFSITAYMVQSLRFISDIEQSPRMETHKFIERVMHMSFSVVLGAAAILTKGVMMQSILGDKVFAQSAYTVALVILLVIFAITIFAFIKRHRFWNFISKKWIFPGSLVFIAIVFPLEIYRQIYFLLILLLALVILQFNIKAFKHRQLRNNLGLYYITFGYLGILLSSTLSTNYLETYFNTFSLSIMSFLMLGFFVFFTTLFIEKIDESALTLENMDMIIHDKDEALHRMALYDELTGIPNRTAFERDLACYSQPTYVGLFNVHGFMNYNKLFGFDRGDKILEELAETLVYINSENASVYRYYSDKFLIIFPLDSKKHVVKTLKRIYTTLESTSFHGITLQAYTGIALYDRTEIQPGTSAVLTALEIASSIAKRSESSIYEYAQKDNLTHNKKIDIELKLKRAISDKSFEVYYQPQVDVKSREIKSFEALIRWKSGDVYISPGEFIPLAESKGLMAPITRIVVEKVFMDSVNEPYFKNRRISINLSADQLVSNAFVKFVQDRMDYYRLNPKNIVFEITETSLFNDMERVNQTLKTIKKMGFELSLDDFGHGFSSLFRFSRLDIDEIKFDKSFVEDIENIKTYSTMQKTAELFKVFNMRIVVEGVETEAQLKAVESMDVDMIQGYYFAKPAPLSQLRDTHN